MVEHVSRRAFLAGTAGAGTLAVAGCLTTTNEGYEVWALDQGTDTIYIYDAHSEPEEDDVEFEEADTIDTAASDGYAPSTIQFSSEYDYAAVACPDGNRTVIYQTEDKHPVTTLETGPKTQFAGFTPANDAIVADVTGENKIVRVDADLQEEEFEIDDEIVVDETVDGLDASAGTPVFHSSTRDGRSVHPLGPSYEHGGVVIVDHEQFTIESAIPGEELPANSEVYPHPTEDKLYLTAGMPTGPDGNADGVGEYYVLDTGTDEVVYRSETAGSDAHALWLAPDGDELWVLNRETNDGVVVDPETDEVVDEVPAFGPAQSDTVDQRDAPEDLSFSPDGKYVFASLRGPLSISTDPPVPAGVTPGVAVLDAATRERAQVIEPDPIDDYSRKDIEAAFAGEEGAPAIPDFGGLGIRPTDDFDGYTAPPYGNNTS
jgi:DNA-binding beta-propeller fold protein YncE